MSKHLSLADRALIERFIAQDFTFTAMAKRLERSPSTISREVKLHRVFADHFQDGARECTEFHSCLRRNLCPDETPYSCFSRCKLCREYDCRSICTSYVPSHCALLDKPPYVCTGCSKQKTCKRNHSYYTAHRAHSEYLKVLRGCRRGIHATPEDLIDISELISPLILKGQSLNHIYSSHAAELRFSERTLYNYIDQGAFKIRNLDLPKKVKYSQRRPKPVLTKLEYSYRRGRSYTDFESYMQQNPNVNVVEMDTVKGARGSGKVLLTMIFRSSNFMLIFLLPDGTIKSVLAVFDMLTRMLGLETFRKLFQVILTDNGVEFKAPHEMEHAPNGCQRTRLFYCDPQASWQKPHIEKNHVFIRQILPKGTPFGKLTDDDVTLVARHINSVSREMFENKTPFEMLDKTTYEKLLDSLYLIPVPSDEVILKPTLLKH